MAGDLVPRVDVDPIHIELPFVAANLMEGETRGIELAIDWRLPEQGWRLRAGYTYLQMDLRVGPGVDPLFEVGEEESPEHQFFVRASMKLSRAVEMDWTARFVDRLPAQTQNLERYLGLDGRLGWKPVPHVEFSLTGQNLLDGRHPEFMAFFIDTLPTETQRAVYGAITWTF